MKVNLSKSAFAVAVVLFGLVACADDAEPPAGDTGATTDAGPASTIPPASTPAPTSSAVKKCPSSCKVDSDCASVCPDLPGGVQCCDAKSGTCFGSKTATCPAPEPTNPDPTPTY